MPQETDGEACCLDGDCIFCVTDEDRAYLPGLHIVDEAQENAEQKMMPNDQLSFEQNANPALQLAAAEDPEVYALLKGDLGI